MPNPYLDGPAVSATPDDVESAAPASTGNPYLDGAPVSSVMARYSTPTSSEDTSSGWGTGTVSGLGIAALAGGAALALHQNPGTMGKIAQYANAARQQLMLSGLAPVKSLLGNVGAGVTASIERGSMAPIKEVLSPETLKDAVTAWRASKTAPDVAGQVTLRNPFTGNALQTPGRFMGALDEATQTALKRAGLSSEDAANEVLQTPLGKNLGPFGSYLDNPVTNYLVPFRRTPFNQAIEGIKILKKAAEGDPAARRVTMTMMGGGAVHGAATADDQHPLSIPLAASAAGRGSVPYALGALLGRYVIGGAKTSGDITGTMLPVSEYGINQSIMDPMRPFEEPAAMSALRRVTGK